MQSYIIAKFSMANEIWIFKKGIGLFSVSHIRNSVCHVNLEESEQLSPFKLESSKQILRLACNTQIKNFTILSDQKFLKF